MANYQLQVENLRYDPTAWLAEVDKNLERAKQEHRAAEVAYGEMQSKADLFEKLANDVQGKDSQAYQNYINFAKTLRQHTDLLATQGVNPALWRNLMQAKSDYSRIIHPIEEAWNARDREAQRQAKYLEAHPHAIFEKDARDMGIDQWLKNPHYVAKSIDREVVANRAMERYKALQKQVMEMVSQSGMTPDAISRMTPTQVHAYVKQNAPYLYEAIEKRGVSPEEVQRFMAGDPTAIGSILTNVMDETLGMYGLSNWNTDYDHFDIDQNRRRRDNINDMLKSTIVGESTNAIGDSEFKQYKDDISGSLALRWAELEEQKRHNKELEKAAGNKGGGGRSTKDKWGYYWETTPSTTDVSSDAKKVVEEAISAQQKRAFITAQPELAKVLTTDAWNRILKDIAEEHQIGSVQAINVSSFINEIIEKANQYKQRNIKSYNEDFNAKYYKDPDKAKDYNSDGTVNESGRRKLTNMITDHESWMNKNVRSLYKNGKTYGEDEADEDEVLANLATYDNTASVISDISDDDAKNDFSAFKRQADVTTDNVDDRRKKNFFIDLDTGEAYPESDIGTSQDDIFDLLDTFESSDGKDNKVTGRNWGRTIRYDKNGNAHLAIRFKSSKGWKTVGYQPDIYGSETLNQTAQEMLNILTESNNILRSKTATRANKEKAKLNKEKAIAAIGVLNAISKDQQTKQFRIGYDGEIEYTEQDIINMIDEIVNNTDNTNQ